MLFHSLLICFQGLTVVHSLQGHHLHHYSRHLDARHNKPNDILTIGTQSVSAPSTASSNTGVSLWISRVMLRPIFQLFRTFLREACQWEVLC